MLKSMDSGKKERGSPEIDGRRVNSIDRPNVVYGVPV